MSPRELAELARIGEGDGKTLAALALLKLKHPRLGPEPPPFTRVHRGEAEQARPLAEWDLNNVPADRA
ncbi:MAG: hypothetical protein DRI26_09675 [Chloroflexi bacterium]|nr:MAG: hypothetical protein DRI26_09675 [Chloroflexota bacterium]